jgi:hypothetical protein
MKLDEFHYLAEEKIMSAAIQKKKKKQSETNSSHWKLWRLAVVWLFPTAN